MSWSSRLGGLVSGRFSPFGRSASSDDSPTVTASDYSYITPDDLDSPTGPTTPGAGTDVLIFKHKRAHHPIHFPAGCVASGALTMGAARAACARKLDVAPDRLRLYFRGRNLTPLPDSAPARDAGLRGDAQCEILCVVADAAPPAATPAEADDDDEDEAEDDDIDTDRATAAAGATKKKRNRRGKKKSSRKSTGTSTPTAGDGGVALPSGTSTPTHTPAPKPIAKPQTPMEKLTAIGEHLHDVLAPACVAFASSPPADRTKREFEHKRLGESVLAQVILKLDGVEVEGDEEARQRRRELVREAQGWLNRLDEIAKGM